jgi:hypothetical protein
MIIPTQMMTIMSIERFAPRGEVVELACGTGAQVQGTPEFFIYGQATPAS